MSNQHFLRVPYLAKLDNVIQPGQSLVVRGIITGKNFVINLALGPRIDPYTDEVALHMSYREEDKNFVLNSYEGGWKKEERHGTSLRSGQPFDIRIRAHADRFEIFADHQKLGDFKHRLPLSNICYVHVNYDCRLQTIAWEGNYYPMPYKAAVTKTFTPGTKLFVTGVPEKSAKRFSIDLYVNDDIAFHYCPRLSEGLVVRNSRVDGKWYAEERQGSLPFERSKQFDVVIVNEGQAFQVYVNGEHHIQFVHRTEPSTINSVGVDGDVQLHGIAFD